MLSNFTAPISCTYKYSFLTKTFFAMKNVLLCVCRKTHHLSKKQIAAKLCMTTKEYKKLEKGNLLLTRKQASQLSEVYKIDPKYFLKSSRQLDLLLLRGAIVKAFTLESDVRNLLIKKLNPHTPDGTMRNETEAKTKNRGDEQETSHQ